MVRSALNHRKVAFAEPLLATPYLARSTRLMAIQADITDNTRCARLRPGVLGRMSSAP
jgi:hypothetical protein